MTYLLALDQGTTSSRAVIFDDQSRLVGMAQQEFPQLYPHPGWVEHDPEALWSSQLETAHLALSKTRLKASDIRAIGITNQRETTVVWERATGRPIHNAIVWQDRRTADACDALREAGHADMIREHTGLILDPYFSGTKLAWILDHVPNARARAERGELAFGTVDTWLMWRLTGGRVHATDPSNAARTMLYDIRHNRWDDALLELLRIPHAVLPQVQPSASTFGETDRDCLGASITIGGVAGDQQAALFGQACHQPGMVKNTYGTGCFMLMHTGQELRHSAHGLLGSAAAQTGTAPEFVLEGSIFIAGALVQWLRDGLGMIRSAGEIEPLARSVPDAGGVVVVPAFVGLGSPYWDAQARGAMFGLTRGSTRAHIARAALDAIAFQSAELIEAMQADAGAPVEALRVDGGAIGNDLLMQIQADLLGVPVIRPRVAETTALGVAYLAGITAGVWTTAESVAGQWQADRVFGPAISRDEAAERMAWWRKAVDRSREWAEE
jgi:glycerol kinase